MRLSALGLLSKVASKTFYEVAPMALASVIATMLVNHYGRQPAPPSVVVEAPQPPPSAMAAFKALTDEHALIVDYLKHDAEVRRDANVEPATQSAETAAAHATGSRSGSPKRAARASAKPPSEDRLGATEPILAPASFVVSPEPFERTPAAGDPLPLTPDFSFLPSTEALQQSLAGAAITEAQAAAGAVRDWVVGVARLPGKTLSSPVVRSLATSLTPGGGAHPSRRDELATPFSLDP